MKILISLLIFLSLNTWGRGGSSTGGGSERIETFKAYGHIYATLIKDITEEERKSYGISVTTKQLRNKIVSMSDQIFELNKSHNFFIFNESAQIIAEVKNGYISQDSNSKDGFYGINNIFMPGELVIFISRSWKESDYTIPLKEYLRAIGLQHELPAVLDYLSDKDIKAFKLNITKDHYRDYRVRYEDGVYQTNSTIIKNSRCRFTPHIRKEFIKEYGENNLENKNFVKTFLEDCVNSAAVEYAAQLCDKSYETATVWNLNPDYSKLTKFRLAPLKCRKRDGISECERGYTATCSYWFKKKPAELD